MKARADELSGLLQALVDGGWTTAQVQEAFGARLEPESGKECDE